MLSAVVAAKMDTGRGTARPLTLKEEMMRRLHQVMLVAAGLAFAGFTGQAQAKSDGLLLVGTKAEVLKMMEGSRVTPVLTQSGEGDMVAVSLTNGEMRCFEGEAVKEIIEFVGEVVEGGIAFTLDIGSKLWDLVKSLPPTAVKAVKHALKAAAWIVSHGVDLIVDGATFVVQTSAQILKHVAGFLKHVIEGDRLGG